MRLFDLHDPFFRPIWRRVAVVAFCLGWAVFEFAGGAPFWGVIFMALGLFSLWQFFFVAWPDEDQAGDGE